MALGLGEIERVCKDAVDFFAKVRVNFLDNYFVYFNINTYLASWAPLSYTAHS